MASFKQLKCGCKIPLDDQGKIDIDYDNLNHECQKTWALYAEGHTRSIFQLESRLCQTWAKELNPKSIKDAADLIAIVRPGTLHAENEDGISMTKLFCDRKNGKLTYDNDSALSLLLQDTYSIIVYQEQLMMISKKLASFDGKMANKLMKSVGKKDAELLFSLEKQFVDGCVKTNIVGEQEARVIFENIKASARYLFNKSHSYEYAMVGYQTAWVKAHFPEQYICGWLKISKTEAKPLEEIRAMMSEARRLKIKVYAPSARNLPKTEFFIEKGAVYFGLSSIKNCSEAAYEKLIKSGYDFSKMGWTEFLVNCSGMLSKKQMVPMIQVGCFDDFSLMSRLQCEHEYNQWLSISVKLKSKIVAKYNENMSKYKTLVSLLEDYTAGDPKNATKLLSIVDTVVSPPTNLNDSKKNLIEHEKILLGVNITCSHIERALIPTGTHRCRDINKAEYDRNKIYRVVGEISEFQEFKIKNGKLAGQMMGTIKLNDNTEELDVVVFPDALDQFQSALYEGNIVLIQGKRSNKGGLILGEIFEV